MTHPALLPRVRRMAALDAERSKRLKQIAHLALTIQERWRSVSSDRCRMLSIGDACDCTFCLVDRLRALAVEG